MTTPTTTRPDRRPRRLPWLVTFHPARGAGIGGQYQCGTRREAEARAETTRANGWAGVQVRWIGDHLVPPLTEPADPDADFPVDYAPLMLRAAELIAGDVVAMSEERPGGRCWPLDSATPPAWRTVAGVEPLEVPERSIRPDTRVLFADGTRAEVKGWARFRAADDTDPATLRRISPVTGREGS